MITPQDRAHICTGLSVLLKQHVEDKEQTIEHLVASCPELMDYERDSIKRYFGTGKKVKDL